MCAHFNLTFIGKYLGLDDKKISLFNLLDNLDEEKHIFELNREKTKSGLIFTPHVNGRFGQYKLSVNLILIKMVNAKKLNETEIENLESVEI